MDVFEKLVEFEWLGDYGRVGQILDVRMSRQDERDGIRQPPQAKGFSEHPRSSTTRHGIVGENELIPHRAEPSQPFMSARRLIDLESFELQRRREHPSKVFLVVDNENVLVPHTPFLSGLRAKFLPELALTVEITKELNCSANVPAAIDADGFAGHEAGLEQE